MNRKFALTPTSTNGKPKQSPNGLKPAISEEMANEIKELYKNQKLTQTELANKYNVSQITVWRIINNQGCYNPLHGDRLNNFEIGDGLGFEFKFVEPYIDEISNLHNVLKNFDIDEIKVQGIVNDGMKFEQPLTYFSGSSLIEKLLNLYYTMLLNPPQLLVVIIPGYEPIQVA